jgi:hypothetical protein
MRIVLEATGSYHRAVVAALTAAALPLVVVNPRGDPHDLRWVRPCAGDPVHEYTGGGPVQPRPQTVL